PVIGVTPSAEKTCALKISGIISHMPPVVPCGNRSRRLTFQASPSPVFWTSIPKLPHCPRFIVVGPDFLTTRAGSEAAAIVIGGVTPHSPGRGSKYTPLMSRPKSHLAVLTNCLPGTFAGVFLSTTVTSITNCCPARTVGKLSNVRKPPTLENVCGIGVPLLSQ